jgi:hypothetical protein
MIKHLLSKMKLIQSPRNNKCYDVLNRYSDSSCLTDICLKVGERDFIILSVI